MGKFSAAFPSPKRNHVDEESSAQTTQSRGSWGLKLGSTKNAKGSAKAAKHTDEKVSPKNSPQRSKTGSQALFQRKQIPDLEESSQSEASGEVPKKLDSLDTLVAELEKTSHGAPGMDKGTSQSPARTVSTYSSTSQSGERTQSSRSGSPGRTYSTLSNPSAAASEQTKVISNRLKDVNGELALTSKFRRSRQGDLVLERKAKASGFSLDTSVSPLRERSDEGDQSPIQPRSNSPSKSVGHSIVISRSRSPMKPGSSSGSRSPSPAKLKPKRQEKEGTRAKEEEDAEDDEDSWEGGEYNDGVVDAVLDLVGVWNDDGTDASGETGTRASSVSSAMAGNKQDLQSGCCSLAIWNRFNSGTMKVAGKKGLSETSMEGVRSLQEESDPPVADGSTASNGGGGQEISPRAVFDTYFLEALWTEVANMRPAEMATICARIPGKETATGDDEPSDSVVAARNQKAGPILEHVKEKFPGLYGELLSRLGPDAANNLDTRAVEKLEGTESVVSDDVDDDDDEEEDDDDDDDDDDEDESEEESTDSPDSEPVVKPEVAHALRKEPSWVNFDAFTFGGKTDKSTSSVSDPPLIALTSTNSTESESKDAEVSETAQEGNSKTDAADGLLVVTSDASQVVSPLTIRSGSFGNGSERDLFSKSVQRVYTEVDRLDSLVAQTQTKESSKKEKSGADTKAAEVRRKNNNKDGSKKDQTATEPKPSPRIGGALRKVSQRFRNPTKPRKLEGPS